MAASKVLRAECLEGKVIWLSGRPGAGKSTLGDALRVRLRPFCRHVSRLDGDDLRRGLCADLGFSAEDRRENLRRAAHVARLMAETGQTVICSFITPLREDVRTVREILGEAMVHVFVATELDECERRDPKGMYRRARRGEIMAFTGVSAPFEPPLAADLVVETEGRSVERTVDGILRALKAPEPEYVI